MIDKELVKRLPKEIKKDYYIDNSFSLSKVKFKGLRVENDKIVIENVSKLVGDKRLYLLYPMEIHVHRKFIKPVYSRGTYSWSSWFEDIKYKHYVPREIIRKNIVWYDKNSDVLYESLEKACYTYIFN